MDIGTSKPGPEARAAVPHHLLDLVDPGEEFTVTQFQQAARDALADIARARAPRPAGRGHRAVPAGGGRRPRIPGRYPEVAAALEAELDDGPGASRPTCTPAWPCSTRWRPARMEPTNRRRVVRALEVTLGSGRPFSDFGPGLEAYPPTGIAQVGLSPSRPRRSTGASRTRFAAMVEAGLVDEVRALAARPGGISRTARQALGYRELLAHVEDGVPLEDCVEEAVRRTRQFARRQASWFRRDPRITWAGTVDEAQVLLGPGPRPCTAERCRLRDWCGARHQARGRGQRLPGRPRPRRRHPALGGPGAPAGRPPPRHRRRRHHPGRARPRRVRPLHGAAQRGRRRGRDERQRHPLPGPGRRRRRPRRPAAFHRGDGRRPAHRRLRAGRGARVGHGPRRHGARPGSAPTSPRSSTTAGPARSTWATRTSCCSDPTPPASTSPSSGPSCRPPSPAGSTSSGSPWCTTTRASCSTSGSGSAGWARRWPAGPGAWPPPPPHAAGACVRATGACGCAIPAAPSR